MYKLEEQKYGLKITFSGDLVESEINRLAAELKSLLGSINKPFSILVDAREMMALDQSVLHLLSECQKTAIDAGRQSAAIVINSPVLKSQGQRITLDSGSTAAVRFICSVKHEDWEKVALDWMLSGVEPDSQCALSKQL